MSVADVFVQKQIVKQQIFNEREIADYFGVSPATVRRWRLQLNAPHFRTAGKIFYRLPSMLSWMENLEQSSSQEAEPEEAEYGGMRVIK